MPIFERRRRISPKGTLHLLIEQGMLISMGVAVSAQGSLEAAALVSFKSIKKYNHHFQQKFCRKNLHC